MRPSPADRILSTIGCYWVAAALLTLISSTAIERMREFVASLGLGVYLLLWAAALLPGIALIVIAEWVRARS
jgi:hypothetical protein